MKNKLAYIGKITEIRPIKKADFIVSATVVCGTGGKWMGTIVKDLYHVDELVEVYLMDAIVPKLPEFEFMEQHKWRVSMRKFKKVPSECLIMKISEFIETSAPDFVEVGQDISDLMNVKKYVKQLPANLAGIALGSFPSRLMPKTDEPNFQIVDYMIDALQGLKYYSTVKCDGSSGTIYKTPDHFGCCSRNLEFKPSKTTAIWKIANDHDLENILPVNFSIQVEMVGPGIQKNRLGLPEIQPRLFNVWDIVERKYLDAEDCFKFAKDIKVPTVDVLVWNEVFDIKDSDILRKMAEGKYESNQQREGIVIRPMIEQFSEGERLSFKIINLLFKD